MTLNDLPDDMLQMVRQWREEKVERENAQIKR